MLTINSLKQMKHYSLIERKSLRRAKCASFDEEEAKLKAALVCERAPVHHTITS